MKPNIRITDKDTHAVSLELSKLLADEFVLLSNKKCPLEY